MPQKKRMCDFIEKDTLRRTAMISQDVTTSERRQKRALQVKVRVIEEKD